MGEIPENLIQRAVELLEQRLAATPHYATRNSLLQCLEYLNEAKLIAEHTTTRKFDDPEELPL